jgi:hypothetical protein
MQLITLALVTGPHLYQRVSLIQSIQDNAPGKLQSRSAFSSYEVKFADRIRNCEDVILLDGLDGVALLSCDEARDRWNTVMVSKNKLYLYSTSDFWQSYHFSKFGALRYLEGHLRRPRYHSTHNLYNHLTYSTGYL